MKSTKSFKRIVVKVGSSVLTGGKTKVIESNLERIVQHLANLSSQGREVVLVSSGAIASGLSYMGLDKRPNVLSELQAAAAIGQNILMQTYTNVFSRYNLKCAQILLTREDFYERKRYLNAKNTILTLLNLNFIPIINENDTVSVDEIKFGDNDMLSALVSMLIEADGLEILSNVEGLCRTYDKKKKCFVNLVKMVEKITPEIEIVVGEKGSQTTVGGMDSKISAVKIATNVGIPVVLANGLSDSLKIDFTNPDKCSGTYFAAVSKSMASKKHWIAFGAKAKGKIIIDDGAKRALLTKAASLLSPGITNIKGEFAGKDVVDIVDKNEVVLAKGITSYSSEELSKVKGKRLEKEVVHRDNLVLLQ